jgi:hypothetical protein
VAVAKPYVTGLSSAESVENTRDEGWSKPMTDRCAEDGQGQLTDCSSIQIGKEPWILWTSSRKVQDEFSFGW